MVVVFKVGDRVACLSDTVGEAVFRYVLIAETKLVGDEEVPDLIVGDKVCVDKEDGQRKRETQRCTNIE